MDRKKYNINTIDDFYGSINNKQLQCGLLDFDAKIVFVDKKNKETSLTAENTK